MYQGNATKVTDPAGNWKLFANDMFGNLTTVTELDPAVPTTATFATNYSYDVFGHLTKASMPRNTGIGPVTQTRTLVYGANNLLQSATNPENGTVTYTYSPDNTVATKTDAKGQAVKYTYDSFQRVSKVQRYPHGVTTGQENCTEEDYQYDSDSTRPYINALGRLATVTWGCVGGTPSYQYQYSYTPGGLVTQKHCCPKRT